MKKYKKVICGALACTLLVSGMTGCKKEKTSGNVADSKWKAADGIEIDWFINLSYWDKDPEMWDTAENLKKIVEITGVKPNVSIPTGSGLEKVNLMMATGDMPDMMTFETGENQINQMVKNNAIYTLDELMEKYCPEMKDEIPDTVRTYGAQAIDGKLYGLPSWLKSDWQVEQLDDSNKSSFMVRSDIYEEMGSPDMTTLDGFYNALVAFKEKYPTINGKKTIPLCMYQNMYGVGILQHAFGIKSFYIDENDNYYDNWRDPKYEDFLRYMVKLNKAGLTDAETYVKKQDQIEEDLSQGLSFVTLWQFDALSGVNKALNKAYPGARYKVVQPLSAYGDKVYLSELGRKGWTTTFIPRAAKHPEETLKFMRYLWSPEGCYLMDYGVEGEDWVRIDENTIQKTDAYMENVQNNENYNNEKGIMSYRLFHYAWDKCLPAPNVEQSEADRIDRPLAYTFTDPNYTYVSLMQAIDPESEEGLIMTQANQVIEKAKAKYLLATDEETAISTYRQMIKDLDNLGYGKVDKLRSEYHKTAKARQAELDSKK